MEEHTIDLSRREGAAFASRGADPGAGPPAAELVWTRDGRTKPGPGAGGDLVPVSEDPLTRTFRARRADGTPFHVEIQRDALDAAALPATWAGAGNAVLRGIWLRRCVAAPADPGAETSVAFGFDEHPPLLICREKGVVFHPPSPTSGKPGALEDCRAEDLLSRLALPSWANTPHRFLYDAAASRSAKSPRFWTAAREAPPGAGTSVGTFERFARDLSSVLDLAAGDRNLAAQLGAGFPCLGCDEAAHCFPKAPAGGGAAVAAARPPLAPKRLAPVSFLPFRAIALREDALDFEEHCDVLGGATWPAFRAAHSTKWTLVGRRIRREALERELPHRREPPTPLEALSAKLALFESAVAAVAAYHRANGQPHLALAPSTVVSHSVAPSPQGRFDVGLRGGMRTVLLADLVPPPPGPPMWLPPPDLAAPYAPSELVRASEPRRTSPPDGPGVHEGGFRFGRTAPMRVTAGRLWEDAERGTVEGEFTVAGLGLPADQLAPEDRVRIVLDGEAWAGTPLWCRRDTERAGVESVPLRFFPVRLASGQVLDLRAAAGKQALFGRATVHRSYGAWYDLAALGTLLLRALLSNSRHSMTELCRDVVPSVTAFCSAVRGDAQRSAWEELVGVFGNLVSSKPLDAFLDDGNLCFEPQPPARAGAPGRVPRALWAEVLATIAACLSRTPGIGFATSSRLEPDRAKFCEPIERLLARVQDIRRSLPPVSVPAPAPSAAQPAAVAPLPATSPTTRGVADLAASLAASEGRTIVAGVPEIARVARLEAELAAGAARIERLQAEVEALTRARDEAQRAAARAPAAAPGDPAEWRSLLESVAGAPLPHALPPQAGEPATEIVRALLTEGLETLAILQSAVAELGGQEHAADQRNVRRVVQKAVAAAAQGGPQAFERAQEALAAIRAMKATLGETIGMLVEAHNKSTRDGSRKLLLTLGVALRKELELREAQDRRFDDIISRMNHGLPELIARLFDPEFEGHVRKRLAKAAVSRTKKEE